MLALSRKGNREMKCILCGEEHRLKSYEEKKYPFKILKLCDECFKWMKKREVKR